MASEEPEIGAIRLRHRYVDCGPGVEGCGPDCEGDRDGKPVRYCVTCQRTWPCEPALLLAAFDAADKDRDQARAERDAANEQCAMAVGEREEDRNQIVDLLQHTLDLARQVGALSGLAGALRAALADAHVYLPYPSPIWDDTKAALDAVDVPDVVGQRDRARDIAAALEGENAELRAGLKRVRDCHVPTLDELEAAERAAVSPDAFARHDVIDARIIAAAVLARTDPLRAEA